MKRIKTNRESVLGRLIRNMHEQLSLSEELARKFMLATALEPLANKPGCTTRFQDIKESKRLEFFITAAINSGFVITKFVDYLVMHRTLAGAYRFFPQAVLASKFNRCGGKINQGILEALLPIIAAQVIFYDRIKNNPLQVLSLASQLLKNTTTADVDNLILGKKIANKISGVERKYPVRHFRAKNVYEYYFADWQKEKRKDDLTGILHNQQFIDGFKTVRSMLCVMLKSKEKRLLDKVSQAYRMIYKKYHSQVGVGLIADHCAVCLYVYLALIQHREAI